MARLAPSIALLLALLTAFPASALGSTPEDLGAPALPELFAAPEPAPEPKAEAEALQGPGVLYDCPTTANPATLEFGVTTPGTALSGVNCFYRVNVPAFDAAKRLRVNLTSSGDHDVFLKLAPGNVSLSPYECSETGTNAFFSQCAAWPIPAGTYNIRVVRFASQDFNLTVFYEDLPQAYCELGDAVQDLAENTPLSASVGSGDGLAGCLFRFEGSAATGNLAKLNLTALLTNLDLYVRAGAVPTNTTFECRPLLSSTTIESCNMDLFQDTTYYAVVRRGSSSTGTPSFTLTGQSRPTCDLGNGVHSLPVGGAVTTGLANELEARCYFRTDVALADGDISRFVLNLTNTNFDLYVRANLVPLGFPTLQYDCRPFSSGTTNETCDRPVAADTTFYVQVRRPSGSLGAGGFTLRHTPIQTCSLGTGLTALAEDVAQPGSLANVAGAKCLFTFVPHPLASAVRVSMSPPATGGDFDLYVRRGALPTGTVFDCRPFLTGNATETCDIANDASTVFINVSRFSGGGEFRVTASNRFTCTIGPGNHELLEDVAATGGLTSDDGAACFFSFVGNPLVADVAKLELTPPVGSDFDLYLRKGSQPSTSLFDCRASTLGDAAESCTLELTDAAPIFAMVRRVTGSGDFGVLATTLTSCSLGLGTHALGEATARTASLLDVSGAKCFFQWTANANAGDGARFVQVPPAGANFDLYVKKGAPPTTTVFDCRQLLGVNLTETCELEVADGTPFYAMVRRSTGGGEFSLTGAHFSTCGLGSGINSLADGAGVSTTLTANTWAKCLFRFEPSPLADFVSHTMVPPPSGMDPDLYVKRGAMPTLTSYDCRPFFGGNRSEACSALFEVQEPYFAMVKRFSGSGTFSITAKNLILPTLQLGMPQPGWVDPGQLQYWKVELPANATSLTVGIVGDPMGTVCAARNLGLCSPVNGLVTPTMCVDPADPLCIAYLDARNQTCAQVGPACGTLASGPDADLYVQYRTALPTTASFACKSAAPGSAESCTFSTLVNRTVGDPIGAPVEARPFPAPLQAGKYFIAVHGKAGTTRYAIAAAWVSGPVPGPTDAATLQPYAASACSIAAGMPGSAAASFYVGLFCAAAEGLPPPPAGPEGAVPFGVALCKDAAVLAGIERYQQMVRDACAQVPA